MKIVECVPNFSEGRNNKVIDEITREISSTTGVKLLDVDPGCDANRTVVTFAGEAGAVAEAAFRAIGMAARLIDMRRHKGTHPRMGATDVCPFIPVSGITMEECVEISRAVARRVGEELGIPVYLYEMSSEADYRRKLADIRRGEYEGLCTRMLEEKWKPDFGPAELNESAGATVMGARAFLIAYNVNLDSTNVVHARKIAKQVREKKDGTGLKACRAIGWDMPEYGCVQISMNLVDYNVTPPHAAFEEIRRLAREMGLRVTGSELVGLVPMEALLMAGRFYLEKQNRCGGLPYEEVIQYAVRSLGLGDVASFKVEDKILEKKLFARPLGDTEVAGFIDAISSDRPSPGGGSAAALSGSMGAGLIAMVAGIGYRKQKDGPEKEAFNAVAIEAQDLKEKFLDLALQDEAAYNQVLSAFALPSKTDAQKSGRDREISLALRRCIEVPLEVINGSCRAAEILNSIVKNCPAVVASDTAGALSSLKCCAGTARYVVMVNLKDGESLPVDYVEEVREKIAKADEVFESRCRTIEAEINRIFAG